MGITDDTRRRLEALEERGRVVRPPAHAAAEHPPGQEWQSTVILSDGGEMTGRGASEEEAALAAAARAEGASQLGLLRPE